MTLAVTMIFSVFDTWLYKISKVNYVGTLLNKTP